MNIVFLILFLLIGLFALYCILFTKKGEYRTTSYKINPYIDRDNCIELLICDPYIAEKSFFVDYKYTYYLESKQSIIVSFIQVPFIHKKPHIQNVYINKEKINNE